MLIQLVIKDGKRALRIVKKAESTTDMYSVLADAYSLHLTWTWDTLLQTKQGTKMLSEGVYSQL